MRASILLLLCACASKEPAAYPTHEGPEPMPSAAPRPCLDAASRVRAKAAWTDDGLLEVYVESLRDVALGDPSKFRTVGGKIENRMGSEKDLTANIEPTANRVTLDIDGQSCDDGTHRGTIVISMSWTGDAKTKPVITTTLGSSPLGFN